MLTSSVYTKKIIVATFAKLSGSARYLITLAKFANIILGIFTKSLAIDVRNLTTNIYTIT